MAARKEVLMVLEAKGCNLPNLAGTGWLPSPKNSMCTKQNTPFSVILLYAG